MSAPRNVLEATKNLATSDIEELVRQGIYDQDEGKARIADAKAIYTKEIEYLKTGAHIVQPPAPPVVQQAWGAEGYEGKTAGPIRGTAPSYRSTACLAFGTWYQKRYRGRNQIT